MKILYYVNSYYDFGLTYHINGADLFGSLILIIVLYKCKKGNDQVVETWAFQHGLGQVNIEESPI